MKQLKDFKCLVCGHEFESLTESDTAYCEHCNSECEKIPSFCTSKPILKGSGWYETDYKKGDV